MNFKEKICPRPKQFKANFVPTVRKNVTAYDNGKLS